MIHQTAREYLLGDADRPFHVDRDLAHEQLFLSCMQCLMSSGLRAKVNQNTPEFLNYSETCWSSHLVSIPPDREPVAKVLSRFLVGHWVLTWIQVLAKENRLRILIQASKHLSEYAARRKRQGTSRTGKQAVVEQESIESWAVDLAKLVGKFGPTLRRNPASIYKLIPPFCPRNSAIYQQFGKAETRALMVSGISTRTWDDSLARLSFGSGIYASSISAAGAQIAVLASSGNVSLYGSYVYRMTLSNSGTLLVTYGFRTTKVWETTTGRCKLMVENIESRPRPLAMLLTNNNNTLLVGTDGRRLQTLDLNEATPTWQLLAKFDEEELEGHFLNASSYMALNNDGTLMAVAYRGHPLSAWEVDGPLHISHCWRARKEVARGEVIEAVWHPKIQRFWVFTLRAWSSNGTLNAVTLKDLVRELRDWPLAETEIFSQLATYAAPSKSTPRLDSGFCISWLPRIPSLAWCLVSISTAFMTSEATMETLGNPLL